MGAYERMAAVLAVPGACKEYKDLNRSDEQAITRMARFSKTSVVRNRQAATADEMGRGTSLKRLPNIGVELHQGWSKRLTRPGTTRC